MNFLNIAVVGTGGTGGAFLARFCQFLSGMDKKSYHLTICDGDVVEKKNIQRQPFTLEDIGKNKAEVLAGIFNDMYGLDVGYSDRYIDNTDDIDMLFAHYTGYSNVYVLIGTVDNHAARLEMDRYFKKHNGAMLYIDSGNEYSHGQVVFAAKNNKGQIFSPPMSEYFPEVLAGGVSRKDESCEVLNNSAPQHLATNNLAGNIIFAGLANFIQTNAIPTGITYFDTFKMFMRHDEVPDEYLQQFVKKAKKPAAAKGKASKGKKVNK